MHAGRSSPDWERRRSEAHIAPVHKQALAQQRPISDNTFISLGQGAAAPCLNTDASELQPAS